MPTIGPATDLLAVTLLLGVRRLLAVVTVRCRARCFFLFALGGTRPLIMPHVYSVLQTNFGRTFDLKPDQGAGGRFFRRREARSQKTVRNSGADLAGCCRQWLSYDAVADLTADRRSSIRSRSTSQYLRAESSSLSGGS